MDGPRAGVGADELRRFRRLADLTILVTFALIILGGIGHLRGALIGAFAFALLQELFQSEAVFGYYAKHWHLGLGLTIIASVALLPRGLVGVPQLLRDRLFGRSINALREQTHGGR